MKPIKILYWTQLTFDNVSFTPVFFFKPNLELLTYINQNGYFNIPIVISGTNDLYDGFGYVTMDIATMPGGCPNDFEKSSVIYSCTLTNTIFTTYPYEPFIGEFKLYGPEFCEPKQEEKKEEKKEEKEKDEKKEKEEKEIKEDYCGCFAKDKIEEFAPPKNKEKTPIKIEPEIEIEKETEPVSLIQNKPKQNYNITILCVFLLIIVVLILCFYGDLKN